ncbi:MAG: acetylornithine/succinylornithine family transaminase [Bacteroidales bacterium]|nr:acetylornithine/succinylornithine family transaminase [Clostridium sp.]MCM1202552.1 acetylornithine/succinylornithine family transaminase [Bacteroidales bacterium]
MKAKDYGLTRQDIIEMADKYMLNIGYRFPIVVEEAKDAVIRDMDGDEYLDFYAGIAVNSAGNCNEKVVAAIREQAGEAMHTSLYPYSVPQALLAKLICENTGMDRVFFQNSGTEANEAMIKMARKYGVDRFGGEHYHIVTAKNSFHGRTYGAMSATGQPDNGCQTGFKPMLPGFSYADYNDLDSFTAACGENTVAVMVEPVQGEGGVYPAKKEFLQGLRRLCDERGMLLLFDEVQTGWCRCGENMAYMYYGVEPDAVTMAKAMGGGLPIGALAAKEECAGALNPGSHGSTYSGNPVCCAASYAQITELLERNLAGNARKIGGYFMEKLKTLPHVKEVRGLGLLVGLELEDVDAVQVKIKAMEKKLLVTATSGRIIRMVPPLIITEKECDKAVSILREAIEELI